MFIMCMAHVGCLTRAQLGPKPAAAQSVNGPPPKNVKKKFATLC